MAGPFEEEQLKAGFWVGDWLVEPLLNRASREGEEVSVEPKVMEVLLCLAQRAGKTVTKDYFMEHVWADTVVTDDVLSRCISELRKVFSDDSRDPRFIETIRKTGYRLIAPVALLRAEVEQDVARRRALGAGQTWPVPGAAPRLVRRLRHRLARPVRWGAVVGGMLVVLGAVFWYGRTMHNGAIEPPTILPFTSFAGLEVDPVLSPDGKQVAFAWENNTGRDFDIYIKQLGAETPLRITDEPTDERHPAWSSDGLHLAFARSSRDSHAVYIVPSIGGSERKVADFGRRRIQDLAWSPDGQSLVVAAQDVPYGVFCLFRLSVDGTQVQQLTFPPHTSEGDLAVAFSPEGDRLAFMRSVNEEVQDIFLLPAGAKEPRQLTFDSTRVAGLDWTSDGKAIIVASHRSGVSGLWRVAAGGGEPEWIATASEGYRLENPSVARQGGRLTYERRASNVNIWRLWRQHPIAAYRDHPFIFSTRWDSNPHISPDGNRVAYVSDQSGHREIWLCDRDGTQPVQLTTFAGGSTGMPRWSPDGEEIAFVGRREGQSDIYIVNAEGRGLRQLTTSLADDTAPSWSRDSLWVYFASNRSGQWEIWKAPRDSGAVVQVTHEGGRMAHESPDGTTLYYVRQDTAGIWQKSLFPPVGEQEDLLVASVDTSGIWQRTLLSETLPDQEEGLLIASLDPADWGNWVVVDDGIYFIRRDAEAPVLAFYSFATTRTLRVATLKNVPRHPSFAVAPDRTWLLYTQVDDQQSDILLMEHFR